MRFREVYQSLNEARPRPWRGDMRTRLRDKAMPDAEMAAASAKSAREASAAAWYEAIEDETIFEDEVLLGKLDSYEEVVRQGVVSGKNPYHFSWRVSKDGPYKITIRIKDVWDYAKPSEDTAELWKKIKTELKSMLASNGVLAHGVKVVEGGYVVCAWSLHNFEPFKEGQKFTRDDVIDDIKMGIESIVMVCDKWNHEAGKESRRKFDSMEESVRILKRNGYRLIKEARVLKEMVW